ncbi:MAG: hypothetical protein LBS74_02885 [Oscillospiraceae bacterium]|jgi:hypothetical protein|nr:hypothetical protein [Oscillospiraceae bacterium]
MSIKFTDNRVLVKAALNQATIAFLEEIGGELVARTRRNSRVDTAHTKNSYQHVVDTANSSVAIGSPMENAIWEEYGTGVYALEGNGRKTPWIYKDRKGKAHKTVGKKPNRPLYRAFESSKEAIIKQGQRILNSRMGE